VVHSGSAKALAQAACRSLPPAAMLEPPKIRSIPTSINRKEVLACAWSSTVSRQWQNRLTASLALQVEIGSGDMDTPALLGDSVVADFIYLANLPCLEAWQVRCRWRRGTMHGRSPCVAALYMNALLAQ